MLHIAKRAGIPAWKAWLIRGGAIVLALIVCAIVTMIVTGLNPITVFKTMFDGTLGSSRRIWITVYRIAILLGISLAVTPAFKMRFWNIGAEGQVLIGAFAAAVCMFYAGKMPFFQNPDVPLAVMITRLARQKGVLQQRTVIKSKIADRAHRGRNDDIRQVLAAVETSGRDRCYGCRNRDRFEVLFVCKSPLGNEANRDLVLEDIFCRQVIVGRN